MSTHALILLNPKNKPVDIQYTEPEEYLTDNTETGLHVEILNDLLIITPSGKEGLFTNYTFKIPQNIRLDFSIASINEKIEIQGDKNREVFSSLQVKGINSEINIATFVTAIQLKEITGPVNISNFAGDVFVDFKSLSQINPSTINLFTGNIEILLPADSKFDAELECALKEMHYDFDLNIKTVSGNFPYDPITKRDTDESSQDDAESAISIHDLKKVKVEGKVNDGGIKLSAHTMVGGISLQKK